MDGTIALTLAHLRENGPSTALAMCRILKRTRAEVNQVLYHLLRENVVQKTNDTPPVWAVKNESNDSKSFTSATKSCSSERNQLSNTAAAGINDQSSNMNVHMEAILEILINSEEDWLTTHTISSLLPGVEKVSINTCLHELKKQGLVDKIDDAPPKWKRKKINDDNMRTPSSAPHLHCIVDLGNVHDCLRPLQAYAELGILTVAAYADLSFAGYGVSPPLVAKNVQVFHANTPDKNSADVQIIWDVCRYVDNMNKEQPDKPLRIVVATKDLGFLRLKYLVEENNPLHKLTFVTNWETMRLHVE